MSDNKVKSPGGTSIPTRPAFPSILKIQGAASTMMDWLVFVAKLLDDNGIPNVVWDQFVVNALGKGACPVVLAFVIPDELIDKAHEVLLAANVPSCKEGKDCAFIKTEPYFQIPYVHFCLVDDDKRTNRLYPVLSLAKKSQRLWKTADIPLGAPAPDDPDYMLVTDERLPEQEPGLPTGREPYTSHPVKIPTVKRFVEAVGLLYFRDTPTHNGDGCLWLHLLHNIMDSPLFKVDEVEDPHVRRFLNIYASQPKSPQDVFKCARETYVEMHKENAFPPFEHPFDAEKD